MHVDFRKILVPTDFSPASDQALHYGAALARQVNAELHILHVLEDFGALVRHPDFTAANDLANEYFNSVVPAPIEANPEAPGVIENQQMSSFLHSMEEGVEQQYKTLPIPDWAKGLKISRATRFGKAAEQISAYAASQGIDVVVLATHGYTGVKRLLHRSVAEHLLRECPCPVLALRHPEHDFKLSQ